MMGVPPAILLAILSSNPEGNEGLIPPQLLSSEAARYPEAALASRTAAVVVMEIEIAETGEVRSTQVARVEIDGTRTATDAASALDFVRSAREASASLRFEPAREKGQPIAVITEFSFRFDPPPEETEIADPARPLPRNLVGKTIVRGTRRPLPGAIVTVYRELPDGEVEAFEATSDGAGEFAFFGLSPARWSLSVDAEGFRQFRVSETLAEGERLEITCLLEVDQQNPYDVMVEAERPRREVNRRVLKTADIVRIPGQLSDPVRVVENLPGVARTPTGSGDIIVRGSGPQDTGVFIDGLSVPLIFHFGGLRSVLPAELVDQVEFYPGNFSTYYGRFTGGVFDAKLKPLEPERFTGAVDLSLLDAGLLFEVPVTSNLAIAVGGRRSTIDLVLDAVLAGSDTISLQTAPVYYDYQFLVDWRPDRAHRVRLALYGSDDQLLLLFDNPASLDAQFSSGDLSNSTRFLRVSASYQFVPSTRWKNELAISGGFDAFDFGFGGVFRFDTDNTLFQVRDTLTFEPNEQLTFRAGFDGQLRISDGDVLATRPPREGEPTFNPNFDPLRTRFSGIRDTNIGVWLENETAFGPLTLVPGVRAEWFERLGGWSIDPRLVTRVQVNDSWALKAGAALTHQQPTLQELDPVFGNPELAAIRGYQFSAGIEFQPLSFLSFDVTGFYKLIDELVSNSPRIIERDGALVPEVFDNGGEGEIYGLEVFIDHRFNERFRGWLSYTLSRAERTDSGQSRSRLFDFDQTHILAVLASYQLGQGWEVGARYRLVSGNPFTQFDGGVLFSDNDEFEGVVGTTNAGRLPTFHQLDLRLDKRWTYDSWTLNVYLSLTNAYNQQNVEAIAYNFDFTEESTTTALPIYPILGVRAEF